MLEQRLEEKRSPLETIDDQHLPLIAKLVQERSVPRHTIVKFKIYLVLSDKTANVLSKSIQLELMPAQDEDEETGEEEAAPLTLPAIEKAIKHVAIRTNYGLEASTTGGKVPAAWNIWRWEVKDEFRQWLPKSGKDKAEARTAERRQASCPFTLTYCTYGILTPHQAKLDLKTMFQDMSEEDRNRILGIKTAPDTGKKKQPAKNDVDKHKSNPTVHANTQDDAPATIAELEVCYISNPLGARAD